MGLVPINGVDAQPGLGFDLVKDVNIGLLRFWSWLFGVGLVEVYRVKDFTLEAERDQRDQRVLFYFFLLGLLGYNLFFVTDFVFELFRKVLKGCLK